METEALKRMAARGKDYTHKRACMFGLRYFRNGIDGEPLWFEKMNLFGPSLTPSLVHAAKFKSAEEAESVRMSMGAVNGICFDVDYFQKK